MKKDFFREADAEARDEAVLGRVSHHLGHAFHDRSLLLEALTPPSSGWTPHNQRLEYLGDSLLQACAGLLLFREKPDWDEGSLSKLRGMLVNSDALRQWAEDIGVALRRGPRSPRKPTPEGVRKPLSDAMEALLAAVYLDVESQGGDAFGAVYELVAGRFRVTIREAQKESWQAADSKTTLQERAAQRGLPVPVYELLAQVGPDHSPRFQVRVLVGSEAAEAEGGTLKRAQAEAARILLKRLAESK